MLLPTETVYGLAADASNPLAVARHLRGQGPAPLQSPDRPRRGPVRGRGHRRVRRRAPARWPRPSGRGRSPWSLPLRDRSRGLRPGARGARHGGRARAGPRQGARGDRPLRQAGGRALGQPLGPAQPHHLRRRGGGDRLRRRRRARRRPLRGRRGIRRWWRCWTGSRLLRPGAVTRAELIEVAGPAGRGRAARPAARRVGSPCTTPPTRRCGWTPRRLSPGEAFLGFGPRLGRRAASGISAPRATCARRRPTSSACCAKPTAPRPRAIAVAPCPHEGLGEALNDRLRRAAGHVG